MTLQNLAQQKLWASFPTDFNDPFEFRVSRAAALAQVNSLRAEYPEVVTLPEAEICEAICSRIEAELQQFGVTCFTENPTDILMWSHYADHHRGMCLCLDLDEEAFRGGTFRVIYAENYPSPDLSQGWHSDGLGKILFTKSKHWAYEKELRRINTNGEGLFDYPGKLASVIFGCRCSTADRQTIMSILATKSGVEYLEAELSSQSYTINLKNYNPI